MKSKNCRVLATSFFVSAVLVGCGGGSDSAQTPAAPVATKDAEGVYVGDLTIGIRSTGFQLLILETGEFWTMYGRFGVGGFIQGTGTSANGKFTSTSAKDLDFSRARPADLNATYDVTAKTIAGSFTSTDGTSSFFNGGPFVASFYNYDMPSTIATVAGPWSLINQSGEGLNLNIGSNGTFTATSTVGCTFSGTILPRPSGKNVFNVALTFGVSPCALPNQSGSGIALAYTMSNGETQLVVAFTNEARTNGLAVSGTRAPIAGTAIMATVQARP